MNCGEETDVDFNDAAVLTTLYTYDEFATKCSFQKVERAGACLYGGFRYEIEGAVCSRRGRYLFSDLVL